MLFVNQDSVDERWARVAHAVGDPDGALANSACHCAKVAASEEGSRGETYLICVYVKDSFKNTSPSKSGTIQSTGRGRQDRIYDVGAICSVPIALEHMIAGLEPLSDDEDML